MTSRIIALGSDHAGVTLKAVLCADLEAAGYSVLDLGTQGFESVDYSDYGYAVASAVASGQAEKGVVICGSGVGISIAANRHPAIRAALCTNGLTARLSRQHNDANVLALGERLVGVEVARDCLKEFLQTPFEGGRHQRRVEKLGQFPELRSAPAQEKRK